jgi:hypothetical protein
MAWTTPKTYTANTALPAADLNTYLRDNLNACAPALATEAGQYFVGAGAGVVAARKLAKARVQKVMETTTSTTYANLATVGPSVAVETGTHALVVHGCYQRNTTGDIGGQGYMSWAISGATTRVALDLVACSLGGVDANRAHRISAVDLQSDLTPGLNTFTAKYKVDSGTGFFADRWLIVMPL